MDQIDLLLVTHFHLDHAASLPYLTEKTGFKGRVFCTHPTKAVMRMLLADYIRLVNVHTEDILYDEKVCGVFVRLCVCVCGRFFQTGAAPWFSGVRFLFLPLMIEQVQQ